MKNLIIFFALLFMITFSACFSPQPVIRLSPENEAPRWNHGQALVTKHQGDWQFKIGYSSYNKDYLIFNVEIINFSEETTLIRPHYSYISNIDSISLVNAVDPEEKILALEKKQSKQIAAAKNGAVAGLALVTTAIVADAISSDDDCDDNDYYIFLDDPINEPRPAAYTEQPIFWADEALRITHLDPNYSLKGQLLFPRIDNNRYIYVNFPVGEELFTVKFRQRFISP